MLNQEECVYWYGSLYGLDYGGEIALRHVQSGVRLHGCKCTADLKVQYI